MSSTSDLAPAIAPERRISGMLRTWLPPLLLVLVAFLNVGMHVHAYTQVGPIDELQHIDYLYKSPGIIAPGDTIGDGAMEQEACRGLDFDGFTPPPCVEGGDYDPLDFQEKGYSTAAANTPLYYSITHLFALPVMALTSADDLVTAGRLVGALWLAAGLLVAYAAGRRLGAHRWALTGVLATVACMPAVVYPSSIITPDAATCVVGAGVLLAALWWEERPERRWPVLAVVTTVALAIKMTNVVIVVALALYMLIRLVVLWSRARQADPPADTFAPDASSSVTMRSWLVGGATLAITSVVVGGAWLVVQGALQHGDPSDVPMNTRFAVAVLPLTGVFTAVGKWLTPLSSPWAGVGRQDMSDMLQRIGQLVLGAGLIGAAVLGLRALRERALAWAVVVAGLTGATMFVLLTFYSQGNYIPPPARYGYTLAPAMAVLTAVGLRTRPAVLAGGVLACSFVVMSVLRLA